MSITKEITRMTAGESDDAVQVFISNDIKETFVKSTSPFAFNVPLFSLQGATFNFYKQDTEGISINLNKDKNIILNFTANTESFSAVTTLRHNIYRLDYDVYQKSLTNPAGVDTFTIGEKLTTPFYTFEQSSSALTAVTVYTTSLPKLIKRSDNYAEDLFTDKSQYFVDTQFYFPKPIDLTIGDYIVMSGGMETSLTKTTGDTEFIYSQGNSSFIERGLLSGSTVNGAFFSYFTAPNKPDINVINGAPQIEGDQPTFSPIFAFKNVADGDYYKLQVNYDITDTSFTGRTTVFKIPLQEGDPELIRTFAVSLTPNSQFLYRIGNTKEITNVFSIKQNVTTWSEFVQASTANDGTYLLNGTVWLNATGGTTLAGVEVVATINTTSSNVDLGADSAEDPLILSEITTPLGGGVGGQIFASPFPTQSDGLFSFGLINGGSYTITATHPSYQSVSTTITLNQATNVDIILGLVWGDTIVQMGDISAPF